MQLMRNTPRSRRFARLLYVVTAITMTSFAVARSAREGYVPSGTFDILRVLPPAPTAGDARATADRAIFRATRALQGTARWDMAVSDADETPAALMRDFSCAVGVALTPEIAPRTTALIRRAAHDTAQRTSVVKNVYKRQRPYTFDAGPTCQPVVTGEPPNYDYPSGHTTTGWTWATILARLVPDRAAEILGRGRAYGESRIVCGVHNASAVEAGRLSATVTLDVIAAQPRFQRDLVEAQRELRTVLRTRRKVSPDVERCKAEADLVRQRIY